MQIPNTSGEAEILELLHLSARLGRDPLLVQASSGNTSIKLDDTLWIKASGKWLAHALDEVTLVPLCLSHVRDCLLKNSGVAEVVSCARGVQLQASIETAMHAVLPQRVVIHVHSVNTIAWAVRRDGPECLAARLAGLPWAWIPYVASGVPLARAIERELTLDCSISVFVLANHGLVVCGDTCAEAERLLGLVEHLLAGTLRSCFSEGDPVTRRILAGGFLFPCQIIFLGDGRHPSMPAVPHLTVAQIIVRNALMQIVRRIDGGAPVQYLSDCEVNALLNDDVHQYRITSEQNSAKAIPAN